MTNEKVRQWYKEQVSTIPKLNEGWTKEGISAEERARRAWDIRQSSRITARNMMENPIEVELLRERDRKLYSNPDGPSFEFLVEKLSVEGVRNDKIYEAIIDDSYRTNKNVDRKFGL